MYQIPNKIYEHYKIVDEDNRLKRGDGIIEFIRSKEIISRYLSRKPMNILDIGGGTGHYSFWLASLDHSVYLKDPMPNLIEIAKNRQINSKSKLESITVREVRDIDSPDNFFDLIICFGPFYHLTKQKDRLLAMKELKRVLKPNGLLLCTVITQHTSLIRSGLFDGLIDDKEFYKIVIQDLKDGQHRNPIDNHTYFTTSYFAPYNTIENELEECGFINVNTIAVEGVGWLASDFSNRIKDSKKLKELLNLIRLTEKDKNIQGISPHLMIITEKE